MTKPEAMKVFLLIQKCAHEAMRIATCREVAFDAEDVAGHVEDELDNLEALLLTLVGEPCDLRGPHDEGDSDLCYKCQNYSMAPHVKAGHHTEEWRKWHVRWERAHGPPRLANHSPAYAGYVRQEGITHE